MDGLWLYLQLTLIAVIIAPVAGASGYLWELLNDHAAQAAESDESVSFRSLCSKTRLVALSLCGIYPAIAGTVLSFVVLSSAFGGWMTAESTYALSLLLGTSLALFPLKTYSVLEKRFPGLLNSGIDGVANRIAPGAGNDH